MSSWYWTSYHLHIKWPSSWVWPFQDINSNQIYSYYNWRIACLLLCEELSLESIEQSVLDFKSIVLIASKEDDKKGSSASSFGSTSLFRNAHSGFGCGSHGLGRGKGGRDNGQGHGTHKTPPIINLHILSPFARSAIEPDTRLSVATTVWIYPSRVGIPLRNLQQWLPHSILPPNRIGMQIQALLIILLIICIICLCIQAIKETSKSPLVMVKVCTLYALAHLFVIPHP